MAFETDMEGRIPIKNILFSVLIPVYNVEKHLGRCIYSVLEQTYNNFEIIVIDDGSTDESGVICERYAGLDDRIRVYHQPNQGPIMARRNGIAKAIGDYYLFLDSDDYWDMDLLETVNNAICDYGCDLVIFNYKRITPNKVIVNKPVFENGSLFDHDNKKQLFDEVIKSSRLNNLWTKAVKRSIIDRRDYTKYKKVKYAEDLLQSLPLLYNAKRILYIDKAMYNYRMNPSSMTHNFNKRRILDVTIVRGKVLMFMKLLNMNYDIYLKPYYHYYLIGVLSYLSDLSITRIPIHKKKKIMAFIQNIYLYKNALPLIDRSDFSINQKLRFYLYNKKHYILLIIYENVIRFLKCLHPVDVNTR